MPAAYAYSPAIWLPLAGAAFAIAMALYCWRRRDAPAVWPLLCVFAFTAICCLASALAAAAIAPDTKIAWFKVSQACLLPGMTAGTCFVLAGRPLLPLVDPNVLAFGLTWTAYAIALFGFGILDPLPVARRTLLEQMYAGVVVFDRLATRPDFAIPLLDRYPEVLFVGADPSGDRLLVLSGRQNQPESAAELLELIAGEAPASRRSARADSSSPARSLPP